MTYDRFYVASPVCMPNRSSPAGSSSHGVRSLGIPLSHDNVTFVELMRGAGYDTLIGKSHLQNVTDWPDKLDPPVHRDGFDMPPDDLAIAVSRISTARPINMNARPSTRMTPPRCRFPSTVSTNMSR